MKLNGALGVIRGTAPIGRPALARARGRAAQLALEPANFNLDLGNPDEETGRPEVGLNFLEGLGLRDRG